MGNENELLTAAMKYAERGLRVIPVAAGEKDALVDKWGTRATTDADQLESWWQRWPTANIGLLMGNGFVCIDLDEDDEKGKHGVKALRDWERDNMTKLSPTWEHVTPRGGLHLFYRDPHGLQNDLKLYQSSVELRAKGIYVVVPPSRRADGTAYEWTAEHSPDAIECATIDKAVAQFLLDGKEKRKSTISNNGTTTERKGWTLPEKVCAGEQEIVFMQLFSRLWNMGLSDEAIQSVIRIENELRFEPSWTEGDLEKVIFPALDRGWEVKYPYWEVDERVKESCWMKKKIALLEQKISLLEQKASNR